MPLALQLPAPTAVREARRQIDDLIAHIPPMRLATGPKGAELFLQLENLQPIGSYKLRGAGYSMRCIDPSRLRDGVVTVSAGNLGQGVAWMAQRPPHIRARQDARAARTLLRVRRCYTPTI